MNINYSTKRDKILSIIEKMQAQSHMKKYLLLSAIICLTYNISAQNEPTTANAESKHEAGLQFNPYLNQQFFSGAQTTLVYAARYTYMFSSYFSLGPELSGAFSFPGNQQSNYSKSSKFLYGAVVRGTLPLQFMIHPFVDLNASGYQSQTSYPESPDSTTVKDNGFTWYVAPGAKLVFKNSPISVDLMYKFSSNYILYGKKSMFSWRFCYSF